MIKLITEPVDNVIIGFEYTDHKTYKTDILVDDIEFFAKYDVSDLSKRKLKINEKNEIERVGLSDSEKIPLSTKISLLTSQSNDNISLASETEDDTILKEYSKYSTKYINEFKNSILANLKKLDESVSPIYYSSIVLLIKDENRYLKEWLTYHFPLVDHIYIYDNGDKEQVSEITETLNTEEQGKITIQLFTDGYVDVQTDAYNDFLERYGSETRWVAFIDSDEFVTVTSEKTINDILKEKEDYTEIRMSFVEYNANGLITYEDKPVQERFTTENNRYANLYHKEFVQPVRVDHMNTHHAIYEFKNEYTRYTDKNKEYFYVKHYYTKSYEEWKMKMGRGSSDPNCLKKFGEFFYYNPDLLYLRNNDEVINQEYTANNTETK